MVDASFVVFVVVVEVVVEVVYSTLLASPGRIALGVSPSSTEPMVLEWCYKIIGTYSIKDWNCVSHLAASSSIKLVNLLLHSLIVVFYYMITTFCSRICVSYAWSSGFYVLSSPTFYFELTHLCLTVCTCVVNFEFQVAYLLLTSQLHNAIIFIFN